MTIRELKVFQLNSLLPIIRELKVEDAQLAELIKEKYAREDSLNMLNEEINVLKTTLSFPYLYDNISSSLERIVSEKIGEQQSLGTLLTELNNKIDELMNIVKFKKELCESTMKLLIEYSERENQFDLFGFLYINELQEEYKDEYVYLLDKTKMKNCISPYSLFAGISAGVAYELKESIRHLVIKYAYDNHETLIKELISLSKK